MAENGLFWQNMALFWGLWGPPAPFFGGPKGPNRSPWMCLTMSNLVQPLSNPFEAAGGAYVRKWPSLAEFGHFLAKNGTKMVKFDGHKVGHYSV